MYRVTFSPPGGPPYATVYARETGHYGPDEIAPLGPTFEVLRGDLPGSGELPLFGPVAFSPGDFVRIYLPGDGEDDPTYLGEVVSEPWYEGEGTVLLRGLTERVMKCAWKGDLVDGVVQPIQKRLKPFLLDVLGRCALPPGVTIGEIADSNATLYAKTPFELLGDTVQALLPATSGSVFGVNSAAEVVLRSSFDLFPVTHRFVRGEADTPPGSCENLANCIRFPYTLPDGTEAWFEVKETTSIAEFGEIWDVTTIPASVTHDGNDPTEGMGNVFVDLQRVHPLIPNRTFPQTTTPTFWDVDWEGRLSDGADLLPLKTGRDLTASPASRSRLVLSEMLPATDIPPGSELKIDTTLLFADAGSYDVRVTLSVNTGTYISVVTYTTSPPPIPGGTAPKFATASLLWPLQPNTSGNFTLTFEYVSPGAPGFVISGSWNKRVTSNGNTIADTPMNGTLTFTLAGGDVTTEHSISDPWAITSGTTTPHDVRFPPTAMTLQSTAVVRLLWFVSGKANDTFSILHWSSPTETPPRIASLVMILESGEEVVLVALDDDEATGEQRWKFGRDVRFDRFKINGVASAGYGRIRVQDDASLTQYGLGLLRYRLTPQREWRGEYRTLRRVPASGRAAFETPGGDVMLEVQRVSYAFSTTDAVVTVSAGTPFASTDEDAIALSLASVRREVRSA